MVDVRYWHKANLLNALTNVRFWEQTGHLTNRCLPISIYEYTALLSPAREDIGQLLDSET
jgi:hypothetical protein